MLNTKDKQPILLIIFGQKMKEYDDLIRSGYLKGIDLLVFLSRRS